MKAMSEVAGEFEPDETNKFLLKENTPENRAKRAKRIGQLCGAALEGIYINLNFHTDGWSP